MEATAGQYHREMTNFIYDEIELGAAMPSKSEPGKLSRLSPMQFQELATDVYDELNRRKHDAHDIPFLPVRDHYHPKRNQARQKLATLSRPKFVDLAHDVNEELKRRFPHKIEVSQGFGAASHGSSYESLNTTPTYNSVPNQHYQSNPVQYSQQAAPKPGFNQYQSGRSPPTSTGSAQGYHGYTHSKFSQHSGGAGSGSMSANTADDDALDSVDRAAHDLSYAIHSSQHGSSSRVPTPDQRAMRNSNNEVEKLKYEYEMRIAAMRKRVGQLESQLLDYRGDHLQDRANEQLENEERMNRMLSQKNERLENELRILREQLVAIKADMPALRQENDKLRQERARFLEREREMRSMLDEARAKVRKLKTTSVFALDHGDADLVPPPIFVNSGGVIRPSSVRAFQESVERLLSAVRSESVQDELPVAQAAIEGSCSELKADVHAYKVANANDPGAWPLTSEAKQTIPRAVDDLDGKLRNLVEAVNKHLNSMGVLPISLLEAAASHLATSVVDLVKLLKVCYDENKAAPRVASVSGPSLEMSTDNIIAGIQDLLQLVRASSPAPNALYSALQSVIGFVRETIDTCQVEFNMAESGVSANAQLNADMYDPDTARRILDGLEKGHLQLTDQLNDISEAQEAAGDNELDNEIVRELLSEMVFKQRLTSALVDVAKYTKSLIPWLE
ncbi:component of the polarisome [Coemansia thaxteri]|uniref:Component of the polarisome n=1 Tax=Coemansia thaxteri TaxID=2663907 RepID=A0A9W8BHX3_9FUNG|nr:component of the polarisome [Coemansia thaxteri]KAJ2008941.1 component of the polarisome [Coemansia thaxteri]KAJ2473491.1 component of the polarisome [Coemansia sp. RSA 2322]KAJ2482946.1 component of the polarisome [Coemansia sp. RSA 2320]